jgi:2-dehydro-3-deoxy-D-arabinonate dehydratase
MKLYRTRQGIFVEKDGSYFPAPAKSWDELVCSPELYARADLATTGEAARDFDVSGILAPVQSQEVWAAGVTYYRSRNARIEESKDAGGGGFYDRVYAAERPEPFQNRS